jgi:hypothetical protein
VLCQRPKKQYLHDTWSPRKLVCWTGRPGNANTPPDVCWTAEMTAVLVLQRSSKPTMSVLYTLLLSRSRSWLCTAAVITGTVQT